MKQYYFLFIKQLLVSSCLLLAACGGSSTGSATKTTDLETTEFDSAANTEEENIPAAVSQLSASLYGEGVSLNWPTTSQADFYRLYRIHNNSAAKTELIINNSAELNRFHDISEQLIQGENYQYQIQSCRNTLCSAATSSNIIVFNQHTQIDTYIALDTLYSAAGNSQTYIHFELKQEAIFEYRIQTAHYFHQARLETTDSVRTDDEYISKELTLSAGKHRVDLGQVSANTSRIYFRFSSTTHENKSQELSLLLPSHQSLAVSRLDHWQCPEEKSSRALQVAPVGIKAVQISDTELQISLHINPDWQCDYVSAERREWEHEYLQSLNAEISLTQVQLTDIKNQKVQLNHNQRSINVTILANTQKLEINTYLRTAIDGINMPSSIFPKQIIHLSHQEVR